MQLHAVAYERRAPGARASLVCGCIGLVFAGVIFGIIAIVQGNKALRLIKADPLSPAKGWPEPDASSAGLISPLWLSSSSSSSRASPPASPASCAAPNRTACSSPSSPGPEGAPVLASFLEDVELGARLK